LAVVLKAASFLVDGLRCHDRKAPLPVNATIDVLPPFAGG
jgi:molybdopterin synthase sulfur carrier subunit